MDSMKKILMLSKAVAIALLSALAFTACDNEETPATVNPQEMYGVYTRDITFNGYTIPFSTVKIESMTDDDSKIKVTMDFMPYTEDTIFVVADARSTEKEITFSGTCKTLYYNIALAGKFRPAEHKDEEPVVDISCTGKPTVGAFAEGKFEFDINEDFFKLAECPDGGTAYNGKTYNNRQTLTKALKNIGKALSEKYSKICLDFTPNGAAKILLMHKDDSGYTPWMTVMSWWTDNKRGAALLLELAREDVKLFNSTWFGEPNAQYWTPVFAGLRDILELTYWPNKDYILLSMSDMQTKAAFDMYTIGDGSRWADAEAREELEAARAIVWSKECLITFAGKPVE